MEFSAEQRRAVDIEKARQDTCVVAGPGSGKTRVLVRFYERLVIEANVHPDRLLAITFTEKAARNMKERLAEAFRELPDQRRQLEQAHVSTIHGFCARLLRENAIAAGIDPDFTVLDARRATVLEQQTAIDTLDQMFAEQPEAMCRLMRGLAFPNIASTILAIYDGMRAAGVRPQQLRNFEAPPGTELSQIRQACEEMRSESTWNWSAGQLEPLEERLEILERICGTSQNGVTLDGLRAIAEFPNNLKGLKTANPIYARMRIVKDQISQLYRTLVTAFYAPERETLYAMFGLFDRLYSEEKRKLGAMDFSDLESFAVRLLDEDAELRRRVQSGFEHVLMDELQDTNGQQTKLVNLLRPPNSFYAVGDINQSIYGFRYADPAGFSEYRETVERDGKHFVELEENWRSRPEILSAVETILDHADGIEPRRLVAAKTFPPKHEPSVEVLAAIGEDPAKLLEVEAELVAGRILELAGGLELAKGTATYGDIAVLVRNSEVVGTFTGAFERANIPYLLNQGKGFFEGRVVVDLMSLLRVISNPRDELSMAAALRSPFVGVSDEALLRLRLEGTLGGALRRLEHLEAPFDAQDLEKLRRFREQLQRWRDERDLIGFDRLLIRAMDETGYACEPGSRGALNIEKLLTLARETTGRISFSEFVEEIDLMRATNARDTDVPPEDAVNAVRIMTVHAAKGLEFPVVFLAALHKGIQENVPAMCFSPQTGLGVRWRNPATGEEKSDLFHAAVRDQIHRREKEEGNRVFYVAMTRAEEHLVFSCSGPPKNWAALVQKRLGIDLTAPHRKVQPVTAPDGDSFSVRVIATSTALQPARTNAPAVPPEPVEFVSKPARTDQHDSTASVTSIALFAHCPRRYYLGRYLGWQPGGARMVIDAEAEEDEDRDRPGDDELDASEFGSQVHALLAGQKIEDAAPEALRLAEIFRASDIGRRAARSSRLEREFDFLMDLEDVVLRGQIDLWFEEAGELVLADYKTDDVTGREAEARAAIYAPQLRLYALAIERVVGRAPDKAIIYFLRPNFAVDVSLEPTLLDDPQALVRDFRDAQAELNFPLHEGQHCRECPFFRGLCPAGAAPQDEADSS